MKKIGLYLSVLPHSGGSFQYCLTLIKNMKKLDKKKYKIQLFINSKIWKKYLPTNFSVIELKKNSIFDNYLNYLSLLFGGSLERSWSYATRAIKIALFTIP